MKRNSSKPKRKTAGFTLVELVVVIAVLAILAGVGVVAYNGYITYAQKGVDRQTVGEIMHALELADYADPNLFGEGSALSVYITEGGTKAIPKLSAALADAMDPDTTRLTYDKWNGDFADLLPQMAAIADTINTIGLGAMWDGTVTDSSGNIPSALYAAKADEMWEKAGQYIQDAAKYTVETGITSGPDMGSAWTNQRVADGFDVSAGADAKEEVHHESITIAHIPLGNQNVPQYNGKTLTTTNPIQICSKNRINCTVTGGTGITLTELTTTDTSIIKINGMTVEALRSGTATVTCKGKYNGSEFTITLTFNVH